MDPQVFLNAIATVGFPIVACGGLFWMINRTIKELTSAMNNNTSAITILTERIKKDDETGN